MCPTDHITVISYINTANCLVMTLRCITTSLLLILQLVATHSLAMINGDTTDITIDTVLATICPGEVDCASIEAPIGFIEYQWSTGETTQAVDLCTPGVYSFTVTDAVGCTGVGIVEIRDMPVGSSIWAEFCVGDSAVVRGVAYTFPGTYSATSNDPLTGCIDSVFTISVVENPLETALITYSFCPGEGPIDFPSSDTVPSVNGGCDTIYSITYVELPFVYANYTAWICLEDSVCFYGGCYYTSGVYTDTIFATTGGCDTVYTISVHVGEYAEMMIDETICSPDSILLYGRVLRL